MQSYSLIDDELSSMTDEAKTQNSQISQALKHKQQMKQYDDVSLEFQQHHQLNQTIRHQTELLVDTMDMIKLSNSNALKSNVIKLQKVRGFIQQLDKSEEQMEQIPIQSKQIQKTLMDFQKQVQKTQQNFEKIDQKMDESANLAKIAFGQLPFADEPTFQSNRKQMIPIDQFTFDGTDRNMTPVKQAYKIESPQKKYTPTVTGKTLPIQIKPLSQAQRMINANRMAIS